MTATLEHVNVTVIDADATADLLCDLFGWKIRWAGSALSGAGRSVHVGDDTRYLALYAPKDAPEQSPNSYTRHGGLNHIGLVVDDLDAVEQRVISAGFTPREHGDYEPGRRFYFDGPDGIEYELVSYS